MGDIDIDVDVHGVNRTIKALKDGIERGLEKSGKRLLKKGKRDAKDIVMLHDRVWNEQVKRGFVTSEHPSPGYYYWSGDITNTASHANIVDKGLAPEGQITGSKPSVQDIIPWVDSKVVPNAWAREQAEESNIGNWDVQLQALAVQYGKAEVITSFAIADKIKNQGYPGIHFKKQTESNLKSQAVNVKHTVESEIRKELKNI